MDPSIIVLAKIASFYLILKIVAETVRLGAYVYNYFMTQKAVRDLNTLIAGNLLDKDKAN